MIDFFNCRFVTIVQMKSMKIRRQNVFRILCVMTSWLEGNDVFIGHNILHIVKFIIISFELFTFHRKVPILFLSRYLVASRNIDPGETILVDSPLAVGPNPGGTLQCITCGFGVLYLILYCHKALYQDFLSKIRT